MQVKRNGCRLKFIFIGAAFILLSVIFLFSTTVVDNYYQIKTPKLNNVIESNLGFSQKTIDPGSIKVLSWNVYKGKKQGWGVDFHQVSRQMDIILIQEACLTDETRKIFCLPDMGWNFARSFSYHAGVESATGVMTLSKAHPFFMTYLRTRFREPLTHTPKMSLLTKYDLEKTRDKLLVLNIHGINFVKTLAFESQIVDIEKKIKNHSGPIIFAGDFNTWRKKRRSVLTDMIGRLKMKEVRFYPDTRTRRLGYVIDHVFYKGLKVKKAQVFENITTSDHKAVGVEFYLFDPIPPQ